MHDGKRNRAAVRTPASTVLPRQSDTPIPCAQAIPYGPLQAVALGVLLLLLILQPGSASRAVARALSLPLWRLPADLSYCAYLLHPHVLYVVLTKVSHAVLLADECDLVAVTCSSCADNPTSTHLS